MEDLCAGVLQQISSLHVATPPKLTRLRVAGGKTDDTASVSVLDMGSLEPLASRAADLPTATPFDWNRYHAASPCSLARRDAFAAEQSSWPSRSPADRTTSDGGHYAVEQAATRPSANRAQHGKPEVRRSLFGAPPSNPGTPNESFRESRLGPDVTHCYTSPSAPCWGSAAATPSPVAACGRSHLSPGTADTTCRLRGIERFSQPESSPCPAPSQGYHIAFAAPSFPDRATLSAFSSCESDSSFFSMGQPDSDGDPFPDLPAEACHESTSAKRTAASPARISKRRKMAKSMSSWFGHR